MQNYYNPQNSQSRVVPNEKNLSNTLLQENTSFEQTNINNETTINNNKNLQLSSRSKIPRSQSQGRIRTFKIPSYQSNENRTSRENEGSKRSKSQTQSIFFLIQLFKKKYIGIIYLILKIF